MTTKVECQCVSKKESANVYQGNPKEHPKAFVIELQVPYDPTSVYYALSGGTNLFLNTINEAAADMFVLGKKYEINISSVSDPVSE
jgi:hypothetical protein